MNSFFLLSKFIHFVSLAHIEYFVKIGIQSHFSYGHSVYFISVLSVLVLWNCRRKKHSNDIVITEATTINWLEKGPYLKVSS